MITAPSARKRDAQIVGKEVGGVIGGVLDKQRLALKTPRSRPTTVKVQPVNSSAASRRDPIM